MLLFSSLQKIQIMITLVVILVGSGGGGDVYFLFSYTSRCKITSITLRRVGWKLDQFAHFIQSSPSNPLQRDVVKEIEKSEDSSFLHQRNSPAQ